MALALPLFTTLGEGATFFVAHGVSGPGLVAFALAVFLLPAALVAAPVALVSRFAPRAGGLLLHGVVGALGALWLLGLLRWAGTTPSLVLACAAGLALAWTHSRVPRLRSFLQFLGWVSPLVLLQFLLLSSARPLWLDSRPALAVEPAGLQTPVVVLLLDELALSGMLSAEGVIDRQRLPAFGRLADTSTWYRNTTTVSTQTERAVPAILAGLRPQPGALPLYRQYPQNLFSVLGRTHRIHAYESLTRLCPPDLCDEGAPRNDSPSAGGGFLVRDTLVVWGHAVLPPGLAAVWLPAIADRWSGFDFAPRDADADTEAPHFMLQLVADMAADQRQTFAQFLEGLDDSRPSLDYLHIPVPHVPWIYLPDGRVYNGRLTPGQRDTIYQWENNAYLVDQGLLRYSLQVEFADLLIGRLLDRLEEQGLFHDTLLVVVSDHGLSFEPGELRRVPVPATVTEVALVPLFIKYPGQTEGAVSSMPAETIDVLPTIADVLGLRLPRPVDGRSLLRGRDSMPSRQLLETGELGIPLDDALDVGRAVHRYQRLLKGASTALDRLGQGALAELVGTRLDRLGELSLSQWSLVLDRPEWYAQVDGESGFLPARLTGRIAGLAPGSPVLIALNGTVAGSGEAYDEGRLSIMLDPRLIKSGNNRLEALVMSGGSYARVAMAGGLDGWQIGVAEGGRVVSVQNGDRVWKPGGELRGHAARSLNSGGVASVGGWAFEAASGAPATRILLLHRGRLVAAGHQALPIPWIAEQHDIPIENKIAFSIFLDPITRQLPDRQLTVVALSEDGHLLNLPLKPR
jgi:hypothetical protein